MPENRLKITPGNPQRPGATLTGDACNFVLEAWEDAQVAILLYKNHKKEPSKVIELDESFRTGSVFAALIRPFDPTLYEYNFSINGQVVVDPWARKIIGREHFGTPMDPEKPHQVRCGFTGEEVAFDWGKTPYKAPKLSQMILYKLHVRGYTKQNGTIPPLERGTFAGLARMTGYLQELGINAVELMPCYEFAELQLPQVKRELVNVKVPEARLNYWGYGPGNYFAPKGSYCVGDDPGLEFSRMVKAFHDAGIAVIMEFFFPAGTTPSLALAALEFWKLTYRVDGFHLLGEGAFLPMVLKDALLSDSLIFAAGEELSREQLSRKLPSRSFAQYHNGFLEDMRRFLKSDEGMVEAVRRRFGRWDKDFGVINYLASQDGFTMYDMVSYNYRHNEDNGEGGQDGSMANFSWNCGMEGPTRKAAIRRLRLQQLKNAFSLLLFSRGTPMIYAGDEFGNSQKGNNNAYCQDNQVGWVDWKARTRNKELFAFVKELIAFRKEHRIISLGDSMDERAYGGKGFPAHSFHGERAWFCNNEASSRLLGVMFAGPCVGEKSYYYLAFNFHWEEREVALPALEKKGLWKVFMCTGDTQTFKNLEEMEGHQQKLSIAPRTTVLLIGYPGEGELREESEKKQEAKEEPKQAGSEPGENQSPEPPAGESYGEKRESGESAPAPSSQEEALSQSQGEALEAVEASEEEGAPEEAASADEEEPEVSPS